MSNAGKVAIVVVVVVVSIVGIGVWGMGLYTREVCAHLEAAPAIVEQTGPFTSCEQQTVASGDIDDLDTFVFHVVGPRGRGTVYVRSTSTGPDGGEVYQGILFVSDRGDEILVEGERPPTR